MHKTVSASIGSSLFTVEESAYASLDAYLSSIRAHFAATGDADEIVSDIENRIAEEFAEALGAKRKVVMKNDVDAVIARMGTIEDFRKFDGDVGTGTPKRESPLRKLRLYRDADDQVIGGVCAGIAKYFSIDPIIVRLAFLASLLIGGFGVVLYLALWILLPEARTTAEKVEMTGGRVTLSALQHRIDAVMPADKRNGMLSRAVRFPFVVAGAVLRGIGRALKFLLPIAGRIVGAIATIWAAFAMAFVTFVFFALLTNPASPYVGFPLLETVGLASYVALLVSGYFAAFLPLLFVLLVGIGLVLLRNVITLPAGGGIFCAWLIAAVGGAVALFGVAPQLDAALREFERETIVQDDAAGFDRIRTDGVDRIDVTYGEAFSVEIHGSEEAVGLADPVVEDGTLVLRDADDDRDDRCMFFCPSRRVRLAVTMPTLSAATAADASRITLDGFSGATIELSASDVARIDGTLSATALTLEAHDASRITLTGSAGEVTASTSGVSRIEAVELAARRATVTAIDASRFTIDAAESLSGTAEGVARVEYLNAPSTLDVKTSDAARVSPTDDWHHDEYNDWE